MKRFLILAAVIGGALLASAPTDAMAHGWRWYARRGYAGAYSGGYSSTYVAPRIHRRAGVVVQAPGVYVAPAYGNVYYSP